MSDRSGGVTESGDPRLSRAARRFIAREVETRIGRALLTDAIPDGATIRVDLVGDQLAVTHDESSGIAA